MKTKLIRIAFALLSVLILAAILLTLGQREREARPSATSYNPSGLHALRQLLTERGIETRVDRYEQPRLAKNELVIAAYVESGPDLFGRKPLKAIEEALNGHLKKGGRVLVLPFDPDFQARSVEAVKATTGVIQPSTKRELQVNTSPLTFSTLTIDSGRASAGSATFLNLEFEAFAFASWMKDSFGSKDPFVITTKSRDGILARTADGLFATNRFIDRNNNAEVALSIIEGLVPKGGRVVFTEATLGEGLEPSLVGTLGPWAVGMWMQLILLFLVIVFTLGVRFGLPEQERRRQQGQRELLEAVSDVYRRANSVAVALDTAYEMADRRIRRGMKLPAQVSLEDRDRLLPEPLVTCLRQVDQARIPIVRVDSKGRAHISYSVNQAEAQRMIQKLEDQLNDVVPKTENRIS
ncbi:MAG: hypothetical protein IT203_05975 [Fimbriimonadaceae bacterium]|nr:hypothetical protein [Fimbriimonadaceae bacterium]